MVSVKLNSFSCHQSSLVPKRVGNGFPKGRKRGSDQDQPRCTSLGAGDFFQCRERSRPLSHLFFPFEPHLFTFLTLLLTFSCRFFLILLLKSVMDDHQIIERVFERLSPNYRACLWLHEYEGLSCLEIGERLRISKGAVKMRLQRGREQFLTLYREETGE